MSNLRAAVAYDGTLKAELLRRFPELSDDERALIDTLDGISNLDEQIAAVLREALTREAMGEGIGNLLDSLSARRSRLFEGAEKMRHAVLTAMQEAGRSKLTLPDMTVSISAGRAGVAIIDETALPDRFMRIKREPNKDAINAAVKAGEKVPGTAQKNPVPFLTLRLT